MKRYTHILLIVLVALFGCQHKAVKDYVVVIKPVGPSDVTQTTFYIALKKTNFKKENPFVIEILTDENSLRNVVSFAEDHQPSENDSKKVAGWYSLEISIYKSNHLIKDYILYNKVLNRAYLELLIRNLTNNNSDAKLIRLLKDDGLAQIGY